MLKNVGYLDAVIRSILGTAGIVLFATNVLTGIVGIIALVLGLVFVITALAGYCPLWHLFGINTNK
jgi:hypothetical protein